MLWIIPSGVTGRQGGGQTLSTGKILLTNQEKRGKEKGKRKGNVEENEKSKKGRRKIKKLRGKS